MNHKITAVKTAPTTAPILARASPLLFGPSSGGSSEPRLTVSHT